MSGFIRAVIVSSLAAALAGCASRGPVVSAPDPDPGPIPGLGLGEPAPPASTLLASSAYAAAARERLRVFAGDAPDALLIRAASPAVDRPGWTILTTDARSGEAISTDTLGFNAEGDVVLTSTITHRERVLTTFDPPLLLLPASIAPGESRTQSVTLTVHPLSRPDDIQDQGPATQTLTLAADQTVNTPAPIPAAVIRVVFTVRLNAATVNRTTEQWFALTGPRLAGPIAERSDERVTALGFQVRRTRQFFILEDPSRREPPEPPAQTDPAPSVPGRISAPHAAAMPMSPPNPVAPPGAPPR